MLSNLNDSHHPSRQETPTYGLHPQDCPDCICSHQTNNFHVLQLLPFYRLYFVIQQLSREHFILLILLSCKFNNFVTLAKHKFKTPCR